MLKGWLTKNSIKMKIVYIHNVPGFLSRSKVAEIFKDRFNNAYHKWFGMERCIVREAFGEALVEKN